PFTWPLLSIAEASVGTLRPPLRTFRACQFSVPGERGSLPVGRLPALLPVLLAVLIVDAKASADSSACGLAGIGLPARCPLMPALSIGRLQAPRQCGPLASDGFQILHVWTRTDWKPVLPSGPPAHAQQERRVDRLEAQRFHLLHPARQVDQQRLHLPGERLE